MASSAADNSKSSSSHHHSDDGPSDDDDGDPYGATAAKRGLHQTRDETAVRRVLGVVYDVRMQLHEGVVDSSHPEQPAHEHDVFPEGLARQEGLDHAPETRPVVHLYPDRGRAASGRAAAGRGGARRRRWGGGSTALVS